MPHHVFLSYSRKDTALMQRIRDDLRARGLTVWTDEGIEPGTPLWDQAIEEALKNSGCMVVILTPNAVNAKGLRDEIHYANIHKVRIFPLLTEGSEQTAILYSLSGTQWTDIRTDYQTGLQKLTTAIRKYLNIEEHISQEHLPFDAVIPRSQQDIPLAHSQFKFTYSPEPIETTPSPNPDNDVLAWSSPEVPPPAVDEGEKFAPDPSQSAMPEWLPESNNQLATDVLLLAPDQNDVSQIVANTSSWTQVNKKRKTHTPKEQSIPKSKPVQQFTSHTNREPFIPWLPWNQFRLLWWIFMQPAQFIDYRKQVGEKNARKIGAWLASTLTWLPLLIPTLAASLEAISTDYLPLGIPFPIWGAIVALAWVLTARFGDLEASYTDFIVAVVVTGGVSLGIALGIAINIADSSALSNALGVGVAVALVLSIVLAANIAIGFVFGAAIVVAHSVVFGMMIRVSAMLTFGIAFSIVFGVALSSCTVCQKNLLKHADLHCLVNSFLSFSFSPTPLSSIYTGSADGAFCPESIHLPLNRQLSNPLLTYPNPHFN